MFIQTYLVSLILFLALDAIWLLLIAKDFYQKNIGSIMKADPNLYAAGLFYLIFLAGLVTFVTQPALLKESWTHALIFGMFFGFVTYATFDLTSLALLKDFPVKVVIVDLLWGMFIGGAVSTGGYYIVTHFIK
jgi:uncharacterized membrane protein